MNGLECHLFIALSPHLWDRVPGVGLAGQRVSARVNLLETKSPTGLVVHVSLPASPSSRLPPSSGTAQKCGPGAPHHPGLPPVSRDKSMDREQHRVTRKCPAVGTPGGPERF